MKIKWVYTVKKLIVLSFPFASSVFSFIQIIVGIGLHTCMHACIHTYIHTFIDHFPKGAFQRQLQRKEKKEIQKHIQIIELQLQIIENII